MEKKINTKLFGHLAALVCVFCWGINGVFNKTLVTRLGTYPLMMVRYAVTYPMFWVLDHKFRKFDWKLDRYFIAIGAVHALNQLLNTYAYSIAPASIVGVLMNVSPIFIALLSTFVFKQSKLSKFFVYGFFIAISGMALVGLDGTTNLSVGIIGVITPIAGAFCYSWYMCFLHKITAEYPELSNAFISRRMNFYTMLYSIPLFLRADIIFPYSELLKPDVIISIILICIVMGTISSLCWNHSIRVLGSTTTSLYLYLGPISNLAAAVIFLHDPITWMSSVGVILICIGVYVSDRLKKDLENRRAKAS